MDQLKQLLNRLTLRQRITIGCAAVAMVVGILFLAHYNKERDFRPLFTNLAAEDAGQVIARVREGGVEFRVAENGASILVPSSKVAELRIQLASAGLPKTGRIGFELFDKTNFGATDFTEQVNFHRALEGELERTITSLVEVEQARVHITFPKESIYLENRQPAKASVLVKLKLGAHLSAQNVLAICHLTASAVDGLTPEAISVLDMNGNLLSRPKKPGAGDGLEAGEGVLEYRRQLERDLLAKLNATLEPLLGAEKYRAGVSLECDFTSGEQSEETFDPTKSVMSTSQKTEDGNTLLASAGVPGTPSNLPRPAAQRSTGAGGSTRRTENISYQSSRLVKHTKLPQGVVKRISLSVLVDQSVHFEKGQRVIDPANPEKLKVVKDLVAGVTGIQPDRGDQVIVESFPFDATLNTPPPPSPNAPPAGIAPSPWAGWLERLKKDAAFRVAVGAGGAVFLVVLAGTGWLFMRRRKKVLRAQAALALTASSADELAAAEMDQQMDAKIAGQAALKEQQAQDAVKSLKLPAVKTKKAEALARHISSEAKRDPVALAQVVRTWLNTSDYQY